MITLDELALVFQKVFEDESITLTRTTIANDIDGWDSLSHGVLILAIENHFHIKFNNKELLTYANVGSLIDAINRKLN